LQFNSKIVPIDNNYFSILNRFFIIFPFSLFWSKATQWTIYFLKQRSRRFHLKGLKIFFVRNGVLLSKW